MSACGWGCRSEIVIESTEIEIVVNSIDFEIHRAGNRSQSTSKTMKAKPTSKTQNGLNNENIENENENENNIGNEKIKQKSKNENDGTAERGNRNRAREPRSAGTGTARGNRGAREPEPCAGTTGRGNRIRQNRSLGTSRFHLCMHLAALPLSVLFTPFSPQEPSSLSLLRKMKT